MIRLTKRIIDKINPTGKDHFIWDSVLPGFGVRISPKGSKSYIVQYRHHGRTQRVRLGRVDLITVEEARRDAKIIIGKVHAGSNPAESVGRFRKSPTLNEINKRFMEEHVEVRLKPRTKVNYRHVMKKYVLPAFGNRKLIDITHTDILELHVQLKHIPNQANRSVLVLSKLFNLCEQWGLRDHGSNPCRHIQLFKENRRNRFLNQEELTRLWEALECSLHDGTAGIYAINAYKLLILTGCRLGEIQTLKWSYIQGNRVAFPDSKTGYKRIPFNADAIAVLNATPRQPDNEYVICGDKTGSHIVNLQKSWRRIREKAGLPDVRIHDLRHTFASQAVMNGTPLALVSKLLGHSKITTTMRYAHLADAELAEASESIGSLLRPLDSRKQNAFKCLRVVK